MEVHYSIKLLKRAINIGSVIVGISFSPQAQSAVQFTLSGSMSESNAGLQKTDSGSVGAGISFDLGSSFRLGLTHRQALSVYSGFVDDVDATDPTRRYPTFQNKVHTMSNSVDLTIYLYRGQILTPYIFGGFGLKNYRVESKEQYTEPTTDEYNGIPSINGGAGFSIKIDQRFSLKAFHTLSSGGHKKEPGSDKVTNVMDSYSQLGIEYNWL